MTFNCKRANDFLFSSSVSFFIFYVSFLYKNAKTFLKEPLNSSNVFSFTSLVNYYLTFSNNLVSSPDF